MPVRRRAALGAAPGWLVATVLHAAGGLPHDDRGVPLPAGPPPARVIALAPHVTELVFAAGGGARLVAAASWSDHPPQARALARIGDAGRLDVERIVALRPDLVVGWASGNPPADVRRLERLGLRVVMTDARRLDDVPRLLRVVGRVLGTGETAERAARDFESALASIEARHAGSATVSVFYQIWDTPLITVGEHHWIADAVSRCGGRLLFGEGRALAPVVSREAVRAADPQAIVIAQGPATTAALAGWARHPGMRAVREGRLYPVDPDRLHRPTPRLVAGLQELCAAIDRARR